MLGEVGTADCSVDDLLHLVGYTLYGPLLAKVPRPRSDACPPWSLSERNSSGLDL